VRILDAGCGDARFLGFLAETLPKLSPAYSYEFYGFDIAEYWPLGKFDQVKAEMEHSHPDELWSERLSLVGLEAKWPFPDEFFDVIVSNQVGEHVQDHAHFFGEVSRCLNKSGFSAHLFPLKHVLMEWHVLVPLAHRIGNYDLLTRTLTIYSQLGNRIFRRPKVKDIENASALSAEYVIRFTSYISYGDLMRISKSKGLLLSTRYTKEFYKQKLRRLFKQPDARKYKRANDGFKGWLEFMILRYVQGVTIFLEKGGRAELHTS
jgi:SAM-dependent methyltransferase